MKICGLQKLTLLDFPGRIACTVFLGGCNFRCPFCHNASLVLPERVEELMSEEDFFAFLTSRRGKLDGVCISGGEPTVWADLTDFIRRIRDMGFAVKLDTNGTSPALLSSLVSEGLVDYVAMDIKSSPEGYPMAVGRESFDISPILESAAYLMSCGVDFEFRTTLVKELHTADHIEKIGKWLAGDEKFYLQGFVDSGDLIGEGCSAFSPEEAKELEGILRRHVPGAQLR